MFRREVEPGLELRQTEFHDAEATFALVERNREYLRPWLPWVDHTLSAEDVREFIARAETQYESNQGPNAGIWLEDVLIGFIGCHPIDWSNRNCSIGYWVDGHQEGKGIISQSCTALLDYIFGELGMHRAEIRCGTGLQVALLVDAGNETFVGPYLWIDGSGIGLALYSDGEQIIPDERQRSSPCQGVSLGLLTGISGVEASSHCQGIATEPLGFFQLV